MLVSLVASLETWLSLACRNVHKFRRLKKAGPAEGQTARTTEKPIEISPQQPMDLLDGNQLLGAHALLSTLAGLDKSPSYNLPIIASLLILIPLGKVAGDASDSAGRLFQLLFLLSIVLDIVWLSLNGVGPGGAATFAAMMTIFNLVLKPLTAFTFPRTFSAVSLPSMPTMSTTSSVPQTSTSYQQL